MKESTLAKITASVAVAKGMAQKALAAPQTRSGPSTKCSASTNGLASQGGKLDRSEAIRRLVELGLKAKK
jgi:hypothetical protein